MNLSPLDRKSGVSVLGVLLLFGITVLLMAPGMRCVYYEPLRDRIVVDTQQQTISIGKQYLLRTSESRAIPFNDVIEITYTRDRAVGELSGGELGPPGANVRLSLRSTREVVLLTTGFPRDQEPIAKKLSEITGIRARCIGPGDAVIQAFADLESRNCPWLANSAGEPP